MRRPMPPYTCDTALDMHQRRCHPVSLAVMSPPVHAKAARILTGCILLLFVHTVENPSRAASISLSSGRAMPLLTALTLLLSVSA